MSPTRFLRTLSSAITAFAMVLLAPIAAAQQREVPPPVPSTELITLLERAGLSNADATRAVAAHETYFERYRTFERAEVDRWLSDRSANFAGNLMGGGTAADVEKDVATRRRFIAAARQLDEQLVSEIAATLQPEQQSSADLLRDALARRRAWSVMRNFGSEGTNPFSISDCPELATLTPEVRAQVQPMLAAYEQELTRLWDRALQTAIERPLRVAELRESRGMTPPAMPTPAADGESPPEFDQAAFEQYWKSMQALRNEAGAEADAARRKVKDLHRSTLAQVEAVLASADARALRRWVIHENYPFLMHDKGSPEPLFREAADLKKANKIDAATWASVETEQSSYDMEVRPVLDDMMKAQDATQRGALTMMFGGEDGDDVIGRLKLSERKDQIDARSVERMMAILGKQGEAQTAQTAQQFSGIQVGAEFSVEFDGAIGTAILMVGDGQELIMISGDGLGGGAFLSLGGGPDRRMARGMNRQEAEALVKQLGLTESERVVFDAVFEDYAVQAREIDDSFTPKNQGEPPMGFAMMGASQSKLGALRSAIEAVDAIFFADLGVLCPSAATSGALASGQSARARALATLGEAPSAISVDIAQAFTSASISAEGRAAALSSVKGWETDATAQLQARAHELDAIARERSLLEKQMQTETSETQEGDGTSQTISMSLTGDIAEKMQALEKRKTDISARMEKFNLAALDTICGAMAATDAQQLRCAWQRAAYPRVYDAGGSAEGIFNKALAMRELSAEQRVAVEVMAVEYLEAIERLAAEFIARPKSAASEGIDAHGGFEQAAERDRKRLAADRDELNQSAVRRLKEALGEELAAKVGELSAKKKRPQMQFQIGG